MASGGDDPDAQDGQPRRLRSGPSQVCSLVRFINTTQRSIDIIWLNYEGIGVVYRTLRPRQYVHVNTFVGHPWIFRDSATGDRMCVQTREIYEPMSSSVESGRARRRLVYITNPLYTLRERCLQEVRRCIPPSRIERLELPREILRDLLNRQPDIPILSNTMTSEERPSIQPSAGAMLSLSSGSNPSVATDAASRTGSASGASIPRRSDLQNWSLSASGSNTPSSSVAASHSSVPSRTTVVARTDHGSACTSTRSIDGDCPDGHEQSRMVLIEDRRYLLDADLTDGSQLMNNNNNNDLAMNWNCNNNSSSAVNQNIQPSSEVSSSQNGSALYRNGRVADGSSAVSSSSSRQVVTSLRDRLLYQYLECSNGHDMVSSQVPADAIWGGDCASSVQPDQCDGDHSSASSQSVVDSSSSLASLPSCSGHAVKLSSSSNLGRVSSRSSTCTVTSSSENTVGQSAEAADDVGSLSECEVIVHQAPSSSAMEHPRAVGCDISSIEAVSQSPCSYRLPSSSWDVPRNSDSPSENVEQTMGPCHSNSEAESHCTQSTVGDTAGECESSDQNGQSSRDGHSPDRCTTQLCDTQQDGMLEDGHSDVNSTSSENGKHGLSRINEARLPFKKHRP